MRSGRLDRKIEFPHPTEEARARILQVDVLSELNTYILIILDLMVSAGFEVGR